MTSNILLNVKNLGVDFISDDQKIPAVKSMTFQLFQKEICGIVGESGSGKTVSNLALTKLLPSPPALIKGSVVFEGQDLLQMNYKELQESIRGQKIAYIFQDPSSTLNPLMTIHEQLDETIRLKIKSPKKHRAKIILDLFNQMGFKDPHKIIKSYPHQYSGGMLQRVIIAQSLLLKPSIIICDEPTTALDVTMQAQILNLFLEIKETEQVSMIFISHDLNVVSQICDRVIVMYGGEIQEIGSTQALLTKPHHPYTQALIDCLPQIDQNKKLVSIEGQVYHAEDNIKGCTFHPRCKKAFDLCKQEHPKMKEPEPGRFARCHLY